MFRMRFNLRTLFVLITAVAVYVGAYGYIVRPTISMTGTLYREFHRDASFDNSLVRIVFTPIYKLDRYARYDYWHNVPVEEQNVFLEQKLQEARAKLENIRMECFVD